MYTGEPAICNSIATFIDGKGHKKIYDLWISSDGRIKCTAIWEIEKPVWWIEMLVSNCRVHEYFLVDLGHVFNDVFLIIYSFY